MRWLVGTHWGWVKDWDEHDRPIYTDARDDAFEFAGIGGLDKARYEARLLDGVVVPTCSNEVVQ